MSKRKRKDNYEASRQKVLVLEAQIRAMLEGELTEFHCPFCDLVTGEGQYICCGNAAEVINAVLDHVEFKKTVEIVDQVMDHFSAAESKVVLN